MPSAQPPVTWDRAWHDAALSAAIAELAESRLRPVATILAECRDRPEVRSLRVAVLADRLVGRGRGILELAEDNDNPDLLVLAGTIFVREALVIAGDVPTAELPRGRAAVALSYLRKAAAPLNKAAAALPKDAVPVDHLQLVGSLLEVDRGRVDSVWAESQRRCPTLFSAHRNRLAVLAAREDQSEMLAFARGCVDRARSGDPRLSLIASAHLEVARRLGRVAKDATWKERQAAFSARYDHLARTSPAVAEVGRAAERWLRGPGGHPFALEIHNVFAAVFAQAGQTELARPHLRAIGTRLTPVWAMVEGEPLYRKALKRHLRAERVPPGV
ncbi:hypothetical protein [Actinokineospora xionganensis]|uniref:Uncharacterized protein n=1 Tax=Actinokineospora xionganensis TaxID=2684470 RepID=A0ABR7LEA8_9PSEU|nr:hypothetical protein [Actinokineospora xionganensis]MBC6450652.1 hypothetical protein [Actinokineospora xionganensis]